MNQLMNLSATSMSSMHISKLVQSRHDKVKQSIERLVERGVIIQPPMGNEQSSDTMGRSRNTQVYMFSGEQGILPKGMQVLAKYFGKVGSL